MSLMIKGMDMPKNCAECPILQTGSLEHYCPLAKESMWSIDAESGRHNNCPLSEIPSPHGRLIDADKVLSEIIEIVKADTEHGKITFAVDIFRPINNAPTVIEAEE